MLVEQAVGIFVLTLPILIVGYIFLRRMMPVFWFLVALVILGTGYLVVTGAAVDVGRTVLKAAGGSGRTVPAPAR